MARGCGRSRTAGRERSLHLLALWVLVGWVAAGALPVGAGADEGTADTPPGRIDFVGRNLFATADGTFHAWRVVEHSIDPDRLESSRIVVEVDLASVDTGNSRRDEHLRTEDFFEVERWPTARIVVDGFSPVEPPAEGPPSWNARFEIDLHGVTRTLQGTVSRAGDSPVVFEGELVLDRMDFAVGPPPSRWNPMSIDAAIPVRFRYVMQDAS